MESLVRTNKDKLIDALWMLVDFQRKAIDEQEAIIIKLSEKLKEAKEEGYQEAVDKMQNQG